jgi:YjbE family integral membrane protein
VCRFVRIREQVVNLSALGTISFDWTFTSAAFSIVIIDLILAGDNAVVIAMAVRTLPKQQRRKGIIYGSAAAVLLRVALSFFVAKLLDVSFVKLIGGLIILWIAVKLFMEDEKADRTGREGATLGHAVRLIIVADITMALDNMLAVGAASHGNFYLLLFGLGLSIPFVVFASGMLSALMERFPVIIFAGAALLGKIGGEMIVTDPFVVRLASPSSAWTYAVEIVCAAGVIAVGELLIRRSAAGRRE